MPESAPSLTLDNFQTFGSLLKYLRRRARLTQREVSITVGYSEAQVSRLEGSYRPPDLATLAALFIPALHLENEPQTIARFLQLAALARGEPMPEPLAITGTFGLELTSETVKTQAQAVSSRRSNLPYQLTSFVGREREVVAVRHLLGHDARLVTLSGQGGCGKTRLALHVAEKLLLNCRDGVWLVELAALADHAQAEQAVASALGESGQSGAMDLLLVLDNCEHLIEACAQVADRLLRVWPKLRILATSREALRVAGERTYAVPPLELPELREPLNAERLARYDAVRLFVERATTVRPDFRLTDDNATAAAQICAHLDGNPLAIELAAARVSALAVEQIAARLDDRFHLLTSGSRAAPMRHQTLRAAMDWSYELLSSAEQTLLNRLSVFTNWCTLQAVEAVCTDALDATQPERHSRVEAPQVVDLLGQLVSKSLVTFSESRGEAHYRLLDTIRGYAHEKLQDAGEETWLHSRYRWWRWRNRVKQQANTRQPGREEGQDGQQEAPD
jgi:predicted ATPase/transcriptional regulator with XRE-family HTH domain